jgi:hypothetical protein
MSTNAQFASTPRSSSVIAQLGDSSRFAPLNAVTVFAAGANGSRIDNIDVESLGPTTATTMKLFIFDGVLYDLWGELLLGAATPSSTVLGTSQYLATVSNSTLPLILPTGFSLRATLNDTQVVSAANVNSIATAQTVNAGALANLNGTNVVAASATAVAAAQTLGGAGPMVLTTLSGFVMPNTALVSLTSTGNISATTFTITGITKTGALMSETLAGPNNNTVFSTNAYSIILGIFANAAVGTNTSAGFSTSYTQSLPAPIIIGSQANLSASSIKITGLDSRGLVLSETVAGPSNGFISSVNSYEGILTIAAVGALTAGNVTIGNSHILSGFKVTARGGDF